MDNFFSKQNIFLSLLIIFTKVLNTLLRKLNLGSGNTLPGKLILKIYPNIFRYSSLIPKKGLVFISATNGKTTTTKIISHVLNKAGHTVTTNSSGSNLLRGITTSLLLNTDIMGKAKSDYGVFEVDEFALPQLLKQLHPTVLALLNLSRDQLDRYGETDTILDRWRDSLAHVSNRIHIVLPKDNQEFHTAFNTLSASISYFDNFVFPEAHSVLHGNYNEKNLGAALVVLEKLNISKEYSLKALKDFNLAWGRGEEINYKTNLWKIYLAKNPVSFNANLDELYAHCISNIFVIALNDNIPDGRDVSWIYDIDPTKLKSTFFTKKVIVTGTRGLDMAVRLKYSGVDLVETDVLVDLDTTILKISSEFQNENIPVLANYSAMLHIRKILTGRSIL